MTEVTVEYDAYKTHEEDMYVCDSCGTEIEENTVSYVPKSSIDTNKPTKKDIINLLKIVGTGKKDFKEGWEIFQDSVSTNIDEADALHFHKHCEPTTVDGSVLSEKQDTKTSNRRNKKSILKKVGVLTASIIHVLLTLIGAGILFVLSLVFGWNSLVLPFILGSSLGLITVMIISFILSR